MRVLLWTDMEGISRIADHRECWPAFSQYWESGRSKFTVDIVAAASGLLEEGATDVVVVNGHGLGWPNILWERLPEGARPLDDHSWNEGFDAHFQVGFHARFGTSDGFISHTMVPNFRVSADGMPLTESHIWAWLVGAPVLGIVGDSGLEPQLDGFLRGTPFLAVKRSSSRSATIPVYGDESESAEAIRCFARRCLREQPNTLSFPSRFTLAVSFDPDLTEGVAGQEGLVQTSSYELSVEAKDWSRDAQPAIDVAMRAALRPLFDAQADLDLSSEAAMAQQDQATLDGYRQYFVDWVEAEPPAW